MKSPFKFLDSYTKDDREIFFGRDREIEELYHRVFESKLLLVYGVSGTGKSSLIYCGLANKFNETDWLPLNIRRGGNIIDSLATAIKTSSITQQTGEIITPAQFKKSVRSLYLDHYKPVYFIFDQFEELFIFGDKEERKSFVQIIKSLVESDLQCRMIFVMREEYMAGVTEFEKIIPTFFANRVRIEKMAHTNAIEAIKGPCKMANIDIEEGFAEALLEKLSPESADVELTYLQVFLDRILRLASTNSPFEELVPLQRELVPTGGREGQGGCSFTISLLSKVGNVSDLLGSFLEEQIKELDEPDTGLTILKSFVSVKGTKKQLTEGEVISVSRAYGKDIPASVVSDLLQKFVNIRILRDKDENGKYELRHDSLATKIYEKITIVEKELLEIYQFLENAYTAFEKRKVILNANDLKYIAPYEDRLFVNKEIGDYIERSKKESNKIRKRIKRLAFAGFIAVMIISVGALFMVYHLPFNVQIRWLGFFVYIFFFLPLFVYYVLKTRENRTMNLIFLIFTLVFLGYNYLYKTGTGSRIRNILRPLEHYEEKINGTIKEFDLKTDSSYDKIFKAFIEYPIIVGDYKDISEKVKGRTNELTNYIQNLKIEMIKYTEGPETPALNGMEINISKISKLDDPNVPSEVMIGAQLNGKAFALKSLLISYKNYLKEIIKGDQFILNRIDNALNLDDHRSIKFQKDTIMTKWESYNFQSISLGFIIITLSQIQCDIKYCESEAVGYLFNTMMGKIEKGSSKERKHLNK